MAWNSLTLSPENSSTSTTQLVVHPLHIPLYSLHPFPRSTSCQRDKATHWACRQVTHYTEWHGSSLVSDTDRARKSRRVKVRKGRERIGLFFQWLRAWWSLLPVRAPYVRTETDSWDSQIHTDTHNHSPAPATYSSAVQCESGMGIVSLMPGTFLHTNSDISPTGAVGRSLEIWIKESENGAKRQIGSSNGRAKLTTLSDKEREEISVPIHVDRPQEHAVLIGMIHRLLRKSSS